MDNLLPALFIKIPKVSCKMDSAVEVEIPMLKKKMRLCAGLQSMHCQTALAARVAWYIVQLLLHVWLSVKLQPHVKNFGLKNQ